MASLDLENLDLTDCSCEIVLANEVRVYHVGARIAAGKKGVTWKAQNKFGTNAIKIVHKSDYVDHSLEAEIARASRLGQRFAKIEFYGEPRVLSSSSLAALSTTYAIVEEWVEGITFQAYCQSRDTPLDAREFIQFAGELCEALAELSDADVSHNDLHERNILVKKTRRGPELTEERELKIIDTGTLTTTERAQSLIQRWREELRVLNSDHVISKSTNQINVLKLLISWFSRRDQEWVVRHLVTLANLARGHESKLAISDRRFFNELPALFSRMVDPDQSIRIDHPANMFREIEGLFQRVFTPPTATLSNPFEYISAELIRSDVILTKLFSQVCPWYERSFNTDPIYLYGPRGCGKSTILRMLSVRAVLSGVNPKALFESRPYIGVYLSCSEVLRSRFLLFPQANYVLIQADAILFFTCLLVEALLETLELLRDEKLAPKGFVIGLTNETARRICDVVFERFHLQQPDTKLYGVSWLVYAKRRLAVFRDQIWQRIITSPTSGTPDPMLLFDICKDLENLLPLLREKHIAFLLDDYSNQRIPVDLQRILNKTISFAKHGNPIFKVSSEYQGVDLQGIQEGREVVEINVGKEYVDLEAPTRTAFLEDILDIRFRESGRNYKVGKMLGSSGFTAGLPLARAIRAAGEEGGAPVFYNGIDIIADLCSGDVAMALDLVHQIDTVSIDGRLVSAKKQHDIIHRYCDREHMYVRYHSPYGKKMSTVIDALCWLAHEAAEKKLSKKDGVAEPMIKTHLDLKLSIVAELSQEEQDTLFEMIRCGVIFSLDTSRSRYSGEGTERYQIRRILLAKYIAPLGRRDPIKLDTAQKLLFLLTDAKEFAKRELQL